jgi:hypothetical protein
MFSVGSSVVDSGSQEVIPIVKIVTANTAKYFFIFNNNLKVNNALKLLSNYWLQKKHEFTY